MACLRGWKACLRKLDGLRGPDGLPEEPKGLPEGPKGMQEGPEELPEWTEGLPGGTNEHMEGQMDGRNFSPFYSTLSPEGAAAQKLDLGFKSDAPLTAHPVRAFA